LAVREKKKKPGRILDGGNPCRERRENLSQHNTDEWGRGGGYTRGKETRTACSERENLRDGTERYV